MSAWTGWSRWRTRRRRGTTSARPRGRSPRRGGPEELESPARAVNLSSRAIALNATLDRLAAGSVASYGAGVGVLEWWLLQQRPERPLIATDFAPHALDALRRSLPAAEVVRHDRLVDPPLDADVHLLHRVDTELSRDQWHEVFAHFTRATVVFVVSELLSYERVRRSIVFEREHGGLTDAGWLRTDRATRALWGRTHRGERIGVGDLVGWVLRPRRTGPSAG